jgi:hypothetical protein
VAQYFIAECSELRLHIWEGDTFSSATILSGSPYSECLGDQQVTSSLETKAFCFLSFCIKLSELMIQITNWRVKGPPFGTTFKFYIWSLWILGTPTLLLVSWILSNFANVQVYVKSPVLSYRTSMGQTAHGFVTDPFFIDPQTPCCGLHR